MSKFKEAVTKAVRAVPKGKVVNYGQIALYVGRPLAARQVGWVLRGMGRSPDLPWWRVINNEGKIKIKGNKYHDKELQKRLLQSEGIPVSDNYEVEIEKYRFVAHKRSLRKFYKC